jgi:hypothetical protein
VKKVSRLLNKFGSTPINGFKIDTPGYGVSDVILVTFLCSFHFLKAEIIQCSSVTTPALQYFHDKVNFILTTATTQLTVIIIRTSHINQVHTQRSVLHGIMSKALNIWSNSSTYFDVFPTVHHSIELSN